MDRHSRIMRLNVLKASLLLGFTFGGLLRPAVAEHRSALLIGNSRYPGAELASPPEDIRAVGLALRGRGFTVTEAENLNAEQIRDAVKRFSLSIPERGTALVYFSGYAVPAAYWRPESGTRDNMLLPIDCDPSNERSLQGCKTEIKTLLTSLAQETDVPPVPGKVTLQRRGGSALNIMLVDGCYPHPGRTAKLPPGLLQAGTLAAESLLIYGGTYGAFETPAQKGLSPFAKKLSAALESPKPLSMILKSISTSLECTSSLDLEFLDTPASTAIAPPSSLADGARAGQEWINDWGMIFCWCPPGKFTIGSPKTERGRNSDETFADIEFDRGFWIGKFEVTHRNVIATVGAQNMATAGHKLHPLNRIQAALRDSRREYHPSTAELIVDKLNQTAAPEGWYYDLPTEAEWEYAARAGTRSAYWFGDSPAELARFGNFADRSLRQSTSNGEHPNNWFGKAREKQTGLFTFAHKEWDDGTVTLAWVGSYPPNPWGLHDVHGNVSECTATPYDPSRVFPDMSGDLKMAHRLVTKGGSWVSIPEYCRSAYRGETIDRSEENFEGLRLVVRKKRIIPPPPPPKWQPLVPGEFVSKAGAQATISKDGLIRVDGPRVKDTYTLKASLPQGRALRAVRLEALTDPSLSLNGPGRSPDGSFSVAEFQILYGHPGSDRCDTPARLIHVKADTRAPNNQPANMIDEKPSSAWTVSPLKKSESTHHEAVFFLALPRITEADGAKWRHPSDLETDCRLPSPGAPVEISIDFPNQNTLGVFRLSITSDEVSP